MNTHTAVLAFMLAGMLSPATLAAQGRSEASAKALVEAADAQKKADEAKARSLDVQSKVGALVRSGACALLPTTPKSRAIRAEALGARAFADTVKGIADAAAATVESSSAGGADAARKARTLRQTANDAVRIASDALAKLDRTFGDRVGPKAGAGGTTGGACK